MRKVAVPDSCWVYDGLGFRVHWIGRLMLNLKSIPAELQDKICKILILPAIQELFCNPLNR